MTDKPLPKQIALVLTEDSARDFFTTYASDEGHIARRWNIISEALSPADPGEKWPLFNSEHRQANYDDIKGKALIDRALHEGDGEADAALCEIIFQHLVQGRELPTNLCAFLMVLLRRRFEAPAKRPGDFQADKNFERNFCIVRMVRRLSAWGFHPTRNRATQDSDGPSSGCSIVAEALTRIGKPITERAVEEVWSERDRFVPPGPALSSGTTKVE